MFFNEDILFRNGPLALVWMAGNEDFMNRKGRRHKSYVALLKANVKDICNDLRNLFPQMGTAHGINLKKMGTLAKGVGVIYRIKVEEFARNVIQAAILLKRPVTVKINIPGERLALKAKSKALEGADIIIAEEQDFDEDNQFAALHYFGPEVDPLEGSNFPGPRVIDNGASPRRSTDEFVGRRVALSPPRDVYTDNENQERQRSTRKRRKDVISESDTGGESDVVKRLYNLAAPDPRAHTLLEDESGIGKNDREIFDIGGDMDFGNGLDLLNAGENGEGGYFPPMDIDRNGADVCPAADPEEPSTMMGPPSVLEYEPQFRVLETPVAQTTRPENMRQRRNEDNRDPDETVMDMELPQISVSSVRKGKRARRRLPLQIDVETTISSRDMLARVNAMREETNVEMLNQLMVSSRAPSKRFWKFEVHRRMSAMDIITTSGRSCSSIALNSMIAKIPRGANQVPGIGEQQRDRTEQPTDAGFSVNATDLRRDEQTTLGGVSVNATDFRRDDQTTLCGVSAITGVAEPSGAGVMDDFPGMAEIVPIPEEEEFRPFDDGLGVDQQQQCLVVEQDDQLGNVFQVPEGKRRSTVDEQRLEKTLDVNKSFDEMYAPNTTKKQKAARAFFLLLKMQARKEIALNQEESFGTLHVAKVS